jgi:flagellar motor switch protein FliM
MYVEGKLHYLVRPGQLNSRLAVQVLQYVEEDVEL